MRRIEVVGLLLVAVVLGLLIAFVDSRPTWDDTGITAGLIVVVCVVLGAARPTQPWLWALAVGVWIPALNIIIHHNFGSVIALVLAFAAAYAGSFGRRLWTRPADA